MNQRTFGLALLLALPWALPAEEPAREKAPVSGNRGADHWSFRPIRQPALPKVQQTDWPRDELDRFVLEQLENNDLVPNPDADRYTLIRRLAFDLIGLPPTVSEIEKFVEDPAPLEQALERVVDRYLASKCFGERWGRHWLDVVRYAGSVGRNWNAPFTYAWRYRNYVIDSFNDDKPYDRFLTEQLAGDLLPAADVGSKREQTIATGFLALGPTDIIVPEGEKLMMDRIDEQIDVTTRAMLGLTVACARCHDHKYEPITMRDYYALAGIFYSTETLSGQRRGNYVDDRDLHFLPSVDGRRTRVAGVHSMADLSREHRQGGWREVLWTTDPNLAMGVREGRIADCAIRSDGEYYKRGKTPQRGDFRLAGLDGAKGIGPDASGRLELARWITSSKNPLTARVMVNRIWYHLFGRGLVRTVDDFGRSGEPPSHPELLDHLAKRFAEGDKPWSVKALIRSIVLSRTYRLSGEVRTKAQRIDSANELYWRSNLRRLELEAVRDTMLDVADRLKFRRPKGIQVAGVGGKGKWGHTRSLLSIHAPYRTVYLPVLRAGLPDMYSIFDFPNPTQVAGRREVTTVAPQSLFLMNSDFAVDCARDAGRFLLVEQNLSDTERVRLAYLRLLGRPPTAEEVKSALGLLEKLSPSQNERDPKLYRWATLIQALMVSGEFRSLR